MAARTRVPRARATATTLVRSEIFFRATKLMTGRLVTGALETAASEPANGQFEFPRERGPDRGNWKRRVVRARAPRAPGTMPLSYSTQKAKTPPRRAPLSSRPAWGSKVARTNARMWSAEPIDAPAARAKKPSVPRRATTTTTTTTTNKSSSGRKHPTTRKTAHERAEAAAAEARARSPLYRASPSPVKAVNSPKRRPLSAKPPTHVRFVDPDDDDASSDDAASSQETSSSREDAYGGDPNAYAYVFCHNLMSAPDDSFACMYLRDVLRAVDVDLVAPDLTVMDDEDGGTAGAADFTVSTAVARLAVAVSAAANATSPPRKVRLIGSSLGAYVAALYASYPENAGVVDRVMLLAPTFKPVDCVDGLEMARSPYTGSHTTASAW